MRAVAAPRLREANVVADRDDRDVVRGLADERVALRVGVRRLARIAIEVIGRDVEEDADRRAERLDALHLEARHLEDDDVERLVGVRRERLAEVAADERASCPARSRSSPTSDVVVLFPFVPPIATMGAGLRERLHRELDLAPDRERPAAPAASSAGNDRNARRDDDEIGLGEPRLGVTAEDERDALASRARRLGGAASRGFASVPTTCAPRATRADGTRRCRSCRARRRPRACPSRRARRSPQLQAREAHEREEDGDDPEANDDLRLGPALLFVVMMDRRHQEDALAGQLEARRPA